MTDSTEDKVDIGTLRAVAKALNIKADRTWKTEDYLEAIAAQQVASRSPELALFNENQPKPGFARIVIHRNPDPKGSNSPVHLGLNGKIYQVPRGVEVDVEKEFVEVLQHARSKQPVMQGNSQDNNNPVGRYSDEENMAYPFQVIAITPGGKFQNQADNRAPRHAKKLEFVAAFGHWPTDGELKEYFKGKHV